MMTASSQSRWQEAGDLCSILQDSIPEWRSVRASITSERALKILLCTNASQRRFSARYALKTPMLTLTIWLRWLCQLIDDCLVTDGA